MLFAEKIKPGVPSPEWTKNLVIYEISTKNFNSPKKSEAGTFNSLKSKNSLPCKSRYQRHLANRPSSCK